MPDIGLIWDGLSADIALDDDDVYSDAGLQTAALLSIFLDRRAEDGDEIPGDPSDLGGHWGDQFLVDANDRQGSRMWLLERAKVTPELVARAILYIEESLQWMVEDGVVAAVEVEAELSS